MCITIFPFNSVFFNKINKILFLSIYHLKLQFYNELTVTENAVGVSVVFFLL